MRLLPVLPLAVALSLAACSERSPDPVAGSGAPAIGDDSAAPPGDIITPTDPDTDDAPAPGDAIDLTPSDTIDPIFGVPGPDQLPGAGGDEVPPFDTGTNDPVIGGDDRGPVPGGDPSTAVDDDATVVAPAFPGRPDAARLHASITEVVGTALRGLNRSLREGRELTGEERSCLGAFERANGDALLGIDCELALGSDPSGFLIERAALAPTDACRAALASDTTSGCALLSASVQVPERFEERSSPGLESPPRGGDLTVAPGSGVVVRHGIEDGVFEVIRDSGPAGEYFRCGYDTTTGATLSTNFGSDCDAALRTTADFVERLLSGTDRLPASR